MSIIDLFFPRQVKCMFCGRETGEFGICDDCYANLPFINPPHCSKCGGTKTSGGRVCIECKGRELNFHKNFAILHYVDDVQKKIISFKQNGNKYIGEAFAWLIARAFSQLDINIDVVIPIPIHERRLKERGFNQSEVLVSELPHEIVDMTIVTRVKDTPHQTGLNREHRETNLKDCFKVLDKKKIKNKVILLVDDIYTTGSTLNECANTLMKSGARRVYSITLARAPINSSRLLEENNK